MSAKSRAPWGVSRVSSPRRRSEASASRNLAGRQRGGRGGFEACPHRHARQGAQVAIRRIDENGAAGDRRGNPRSLINQPVLPEGQVKYGKSSSDLDVLDHDDGGSCSRLARVVEVGREHVGLVA